MYLNVILRSLESDKPKGAAHYDFKKSCFYKINEKFYKYNGFGWCEVKKINLKNCIEV